MERGGRTAGALAQAGMGATSAPAHLQALAWARLVRTRKEGTRVFYRVAGDDVAAFVVVLRDRAHPGWPRSGKWCGTTLPHATRWSLDAALAGCPGAARSSRTAGGRTACSPSRRPGGSGPGVTGRAARTAACLGAGGRVRPALQGDEYFGDPAAAPGRPGQSVGDGDQRAGGMAAGHTGRDGARATSSRGCRAATRAGPALARRPSPSHSCGRKPAILG